MSTVLDTNRKHSISSLAFLDPDGGVSVQRYDMLKYKQFDKLTENQLGYFWRPDEIDLTKDASDFKALSESERRVVTLTLSRQILLDSVQGRAPNLAFLPITSLPEIEAWITTWAFSETIHSRSYTHILRNVFPDPSKVFDSMMDIGDLVDCAGDISKCYDDLITMVNAYQLLGEGRHEVSTWEYYIDRLDDGRPILDDDGIPTVKTRLTGEKRVIDVQMYELKKLLWLCIMSVNILEGVRFYISFATSWSLAENKKLEGNAKIIKLICMSDDHEILTDKGWRFFKDLEQERVAQYTVEGDIEFVEPLAFIEEDFDAKMVGFKTADVDVLYTPNHRVIYKDKDGLKEAKADVFKPSCAKSFIVSGLKQEGRSELTDLERLRIAIQADGFISGRYTGEISGTIPIVVQLKKERKIGRLTRLLESLKDAGIVYRIDALSGRNEGMVSFKIDAPNSLELSKDFAWVDLGSVNHEWASAFLNELALWDGHLRYEDFTDIYYSSKDKSCTDIVQAIATICGKVHHKAIQEDNRKETYSDMHRLHGIRSGSTRNCGSSSKTRYTKSYKGKVYCVTVPSGMIVVRRNDKVVITGNCRDENLHLAATQTLLKILPKDDPDFAKIKAETEQQSIEMFKAAVEQEKTWARFIFSEGSIIGLNYELSADFIEWIANKRMNNAGLPTVYPSRTNPLPWTSKWISGAEVAVAPQEVELSSYTIGATKQDVTEDTFKGFSL